MRLFIAIVVCSILQGCGRTLTVYYRTSPRRVEVRKEVSLDVDYVIFTEAGAQKTRESYDPFKKAVFLEIPIADASDIFRFLGD